MISFKNMNAGIQTFLINVLRKKTVLRGEVSYMKKKIDDNRHVFFRTTGESQPKLHNYDK